MMGAEQDLPTEESGHWWKSAYRVLAIGWAEHRMMLGITAASTIGLMIVASGAHTSGVLLPSLDLPAVMLAEIPALNMTIIAILVCRARRHASLPEARTVLQRSLFSPDRLLGLALVPVAMLWLMLMAVGWKASIPVLHPFQFDVFLARADQWIVGREAWEWVEPITRSVLVMRALDTAYYAWFVILAFVMLATAWAPYGHQRRRFLVAMAGLWTLGSLIGVLVSSAGPVYFSRVTGRAAGFDTLAGRVTAHAPIAAAMQARLWHYYRSGAGQLVAGISAFPSLHVAVPALFALAARKYWRLAATLLTALTWLGSVVLGWHYLVDGFGGILLAMTCWFVTGLLTKAERSTPTAMASRELHRPRPGAG